MPIDQYGCLAGLYTFFRPYHFMHTALISEFFHIVFQQNRAQDHTNSKLFSTTLKFQKKGLIVSEVILSADYVIQWNFEQWKPKDW